MNRFNRDYALIEKKNGRILAESNDKERLQALRIETWLYDAIDTVVVKSDLPRR